MELTDLQKATSDHIIDVFTRTVEPVKRYLLADEVGLGKTIIAADVIKRLAEKKGSAPFIVYYICGNQRVTAQNKGKLIAYCDGCETEDDRLSMQWCYIKEYIDSKKNIWILPVTPATTFTNAGSKHENSEETNQESFFSCLERGEENQGISFKIIKSKYNIDFDYKDLKEFIKKRHFIVECTIKDILKPDMVILDEFQNYPKLLYDGDYPLFQTMLENTKYLLMLSATPYQMPASKVSEMNKAPFKDDTGLKEATKKAGSGTDDEESDTDECAEFSSDSWNPDPDKEFKRLVHFIAGEISDDQIKDEDFLYNNVLCRSERSQFYDSGSKEAEVREIICGFEEGKAHIDYSSALFRHYADAGWDKWKNEPNKFIAFVKESPSFAKYSTRYISIRGGESDNKNELKFFKNRLPVFGENADQTQHSGIAMVKKLALNDDSIMDMLWIPPALGVEKNYQADKHPFWKNRNYSKTLVFGNYRLSTASCANYFSSAVREYQSQFTYSGEPITEEDLEEFLPSDKENKAVKALRNLVVVYFNANMGLICHVTGKTGADAAKEYARMGGLKKVLEEYVFVLGLTADANDEKLNSISKTLGNMIDYFGKKEKFAPTKIICYDTGKKTFSGEDVEALKNTFSFSCGFAERFTDDDSDRNKHNKSHQMNLQALFNSPFYPFVIASTSVAQEGLDFHNYCHQIVHWSVPKTPIAFEQREGRIDRFLSHLIRKRIAAYSDGTETWVELIEKLKKESNKNPLVPYWYVPVKDSENAAPQFIRAVNVLPFSKEESHYRKLKTALKEYNYYLGPNYQDKDKIDLSPFFRKAQE